MIRRRGYDWGFHVAVIAVGVLLVVAGVTAPASEPLIQHGRPATAAESQQRDARLLEDLLLAAGGHPLAHETAAP